MTTLADVIEEQGVFTLEEIDLQLATLANVLAVTTRKIDKRKLHRKIDEWLDRRIQLTGLEDGF